MDMGQNHGRSREAQDHLNIMDVQQDRYLTYLVTLDEPHGDNRLLWATLALGDDDAPLAAVGQEATEVVRGCQDRNALCPQEFSCLAARNGGGGFDILLFDEDGLFVTMRPNVPRDGVQVAARVLMGRFHLHCQGWDREARCYVFSPGSEAVPDAEVLSLVGPHVPLATRGKRGLAHP